MYWYWFCVRPPRDVRHGRHSNCERHSLCLLLFRQHIVYAIINTHRRSAEEADSLQFIYTRITKCQTWSEEWEHVIWKLHCHHITHACSHWTHPASFHKSIPRLAEFLAHHWLTFWLFSIEIEIIIMKGSWLVWVVSPSEPLLFSSSFSYYGLPSCPDEIYLCRWPEYVY